MPREAIADAQKKRYLELYMKCWRLISMGTRHDANPLRYWTVFFATIVSNGVLTTFMYKHIFVHARDIDGIAEIVDFATLFTAGLYRYIYSYFQGHKYDELVAYIHDNFIHESVAAGKKLTMDKYIKTSKVVSYVYMGLIMFWLVQISTTQILYKLLTQNPKGPVTIFHVDLPYDEYTQVGTALTYVIHLMSYYTIALIYCFADSYWFVIMMLTAAQFDLISHSLRSLADPTEEDGSQEETVVDPVEAERIITRCLSQHRILRRCVSMTEDLLNSIVLVDFLHATTSITFILFDMTIAINQQSMVKIMNLWGYFFISVFHMWILDYFGNRLTVKEEEVSRAIYEVPWYRYSSKLKTEIVVMMILSSHPRRLTGGKLFSISLEFFGRSMRTIFSYFTVLLQLLEV